MRYAVVFIWVGIGAFWVFSPFGKALVDRICARLSPMGRKLAAPLGLGLAAIVAIASFFVLTMPFASNQGGITLAGFLVATVLGAAFVSLQVVSALVTMQGLKSMPETVRRRPASNTEDHDA